MDNKKRNEIIHVVEALKQNEEKIVYRKVQVNNKIINIFFIEQLTDRKALSENIIKPILNFNYGQTLTSEFIMESIIYTDDIFIDNDSNKIKDYILGGRSVIYLFEEDKYIVANTLKIAKRSVPTPLVDNTVRGPQDSFTENMNTNIALIRYRVKDSNLRIENKRVGKRTKTTVSIIYIKDIVNPQYVTDIKNKLDKIDVDGIFETGYLQKFIFGRPFDFFPHTGLAERSDIVARSVLNGKVCLMVEGSNLVLITPKVFFEFLTATDDNYNDIFFSIFTIFLRMICLFVTLSASALYVAAVAFHTDILPPQYILSIAGSRASVPFNAVLEALLMEITAEILREASIRLPKQVGAAVGIVGTIVIGQAAVEAGLVSSLMVILIALATMCSYAMPDYIIINPIRIFKFMMIVFAGMFGIFGLVIGMTIIAINMLSLDSMGVPYMAPFAPLNLNDLKNSFMNDINLDKYRPTYLNQQDIVRVGLDPKKHEGGSTERYTSKGENNPEDKNNSKDKNSS